MAVSITITNDEAAKEVQRLMQSVSPERVNPRIGAAEKLLFQNHFLGLPSNKQGFPSTHLYAQFARSTNYRAQSDGVTISVNHVAARQRFQGGDISPTRGKYLTIPATADAYGKRAREFNNLRFAIVQGRPALVQAEATRVRFGNRKKDGSRTVFKGDTSSGLTPFFWLVRHVHQEPDRSILPSDEEIGATAIDATKKAVLRNGGEA